MFDDFMRDSRHGFRWLVRNPGFSSVVLLTLAIAIGATTTVFSIVDAWLIRPLNFPRADRLAIAFAARPERPTEPAVWLPYRVFLGLAERSRSFDDLSAAFVRDATVTTPEAAQTVLGLTVTPDLFRTLGVGPLLGRTLGEADVTAPPAVVISYGYWQRQFGGSDRALGTTLQMSGIPHEIVGVMPRDFELRVLDMRFDFWTALKPGAGGYVPDGLGPVAVIGRLRDATTIDAAQGETASITREIEAGHAVNFNGFVPVLASLQDDNTRAVRATLLTVSGAVSCLLLITGMNVGTLLLGRGLGRMRETAIRAAIGCGRARLIRQFLTESLLLAAIGTLGGLGLAAAAVQLFVAWNPLGTLPANAIQLDMRAVAAAGAAMAVATIVAGLVPAMRISAADPNDALRLGGGRGSTGAPAQRAQMSMLVAQMAACVVLLVATALLIRTFGRLQDEPLGFQHENLSAATVMLPSAPFDSNAARNEYVRALIDRLRALSGVRAVAVSTTPPLTSGPPVTVNTTPDDATTAPRISAQTVTQEFFSTLRIPVIAGRVFDARDRADGAPVLVLNARAARDLFGDAAAAIGRRVRLDREPPREVIGVVGNVRSTFFNTLEWKLDPIVYRPASQALAIQNNPMATMFGVTVHVRADRALTIGEVRQASAAVNPRAAVTELRTAGELVQQATRQPAFRMTLLSAFAIVSLLLAALGMYGLVSQAVSQRVREIAIRLALGADRRTVMVGIVSRALAAAAAGLAIGAMAAFFASRLIEALVYGVRPRDAVSFAASALVLIVVALMGALVPARRAMRVDPVRVLRAD